MSANWYGIYVKANCEHKVSNAIKESLTKLQKIHLLKDLTIPTQKISRIIKGKRVQTEKKLFPGYILINLFEDESFNELKNIILKTENVSKFLGANNIPVPMSKDEVKELLRQVQEGTKVKEEEVNYIIGDHVRILDGAFKNFTGEIQEIDNESRKLKISVSIFGRSTPIELPFDNMVKVSKISS